MKINDFDLINITVKIKTSVANGEKLFTMSKSNKSLISKTQIQRTLQNHQENYKKHNA